MTEINVKKLASNVLAEARRSKFKVIRNGEKPVAIRHKKQDPIKQFDERVERSR